MLFETWKSIKHKRNTKMFERFNVMKTRCVDERFGFGYKKEDYIWVVNEWQKKRMIRIQRK